MRKSSTKRANGEGTIVYESDRKKYRAMLVDPDGKRISKRFATKTEASQWLAEARTDMAREEYVPSNNITVGEWLLNYIETYKKPVLKATSLITVLRHASYIAPLSNIALQDLSQFGIQKFINELTYSPHTIKDVWSLLNQSLEKAVELTMIRTNPAAKVTTPKIVRQPRKTYTKEEITLILETIKKPIHSYYAGIFIVMIYSGMRIGEIIGLKKENVYDNYIYVKSSVVLMDGHNYENTPKTDSSRRPIALPKDVMDMLHEKCKADDSPYVFHTPSGHPFSRSNVYNGWTRVLNACGLERIRMHDVRHTHATLLLSQGIPLTEVSRRLGHARVSTTLDIYAECVANYDTGLADKLNNLLVAPTLHPQA